MEQFNISISDVIRTYDLLRNPRTLIETGVLYNAKLQHPFHHLRTIYVTDGKKYSLSTDLYALNGLLKLEPSIFKNIFPLSKSTIQAIQKDYEVILDENNYLSHAKVRDISNKIQYDVSVAFDENKFKISKKNKEFKLGEYSTKLNISTGFEDGLPLIGEIGLDGSKFCLPKSLDGRFDADYVSYLHFIETVLSGVHEDLYSYKESAQRKKLEELFPKIPLEKKIILNNEQLS